MKKFILTLIVCMLILPVCAKTDKTSEEYLKNSHQFSIMNPFAEYAVQSVIKQKVKQEFKKSCKVKFKSYSLSSLKKGIFKYLEITGKDLIVEDMTVPYLSLKTETDYNWIDYTKDPVEFKSDMVFLYKIHLDEKSLNDVLKSKKYSQTITNVNGLAYPLFELKDVSAKIANERVFLTIGYSLPITYSSRVYHFSFSTGFKVKNGKIQADNIGVDKNYKNIALKKMVNLVNLINPLSCTVAIMETKKCKLNVENVKIVDDIIQVDGRIFIEGDK